MPMGRPGGIWLVGVDGLLLAEAEELLSLRLLVGGREEGRSSMSSSMSSSSSSPPPCPRWEEEEPEKSLGPLVSFSPSYCGDRMNVVEEVVVRDADVGA
jgi:hypothetical protein